MNKNTRALHEALVSLWRKLGEKTEKAKLNIKISQKEPNSKLWRGDWGSRLFTLKISF